MSPNPRAQGARAAGSRQPKSANPFEPGTEEYRAWWLGYRDTVLLLLEAEEEGTEETPLPESSDWAIPW